MAKVSWLKFPLQIHILNVKPVVNFSAQKQGLLIDK